MSRYLTSDGDVLDAICARLLGAESHVVAVLELNRHLADHGPVYAAGVVIDLPDPPAAAPAASPAVLPPVRPVVRLWGQA